MYPSSFGPLLRASSNPDLGVDPIAIDAKTMTEKLQRTRQFWAHGIQVAASSLVNAQQPPPEPPEQPPPEGSS